MRDYGECSVGVVVAPKTPTLMNDIAVLVERAENVRSRLSTIKDRLLGYEPQAGSATSVCVKEESLGSYAQSDILRACRALNDAQELLAALENRLG